ncbi:hypothetical protein EV363DRAFT_1520091 [Boletus edulis]|nr:hypothetical protein EV363DRAFT_1520091 [Boletus edulis]
MAVPGPSNVTISLLPISLSLVRIPRPRLPHLSHHVLRQILQPKPIFLNVTCNEIELSLFAEQHILSDFELIARRDRQRLRSRSGSGSARKRPVFDDDDRVQFSCEKWKVLQLDSHSDQLAGNSGARVHELSAPLAAAGISILYQSSYMSDFIFVKESRLREVMSLFGAAGFDLYSSDPELLMSRVVSPLLSPVLPDVFQVSDIGPEFNPESGAVLTRTRSSIDTPAAPSALPEEKSGAGRTPHHRHPSRDKSRSPSCTDVTVLPSKLACVGLADDCVDSWSLKVVKLVAFPDLIPVKDPCLLRGSGCSYRTTELSASKEVEEITLPSFLSWSRKGSDSTDSVSSSSEDDEGYLSHSPRRDPPSVLPTTHSRSYPDISHAVPLLTPSFKPTAKHLVSQMPTLSPVEFKSPTFSRNTIHSPADKQMNSMYPRIPFFTFTRTSEGSSLTTDVSVLAALFPPGERHMLICAGELDTLDVHADSDSDSDQDQDSAALSEGGILKCIQIDLRRFGLGEYSRDCTLRHAKLMECVIRSADKHGLVSRYSRVLEENGINHMYSSTFKTANLLVGTPSILAADSLSTMHRLPRRIPVVLAISSRHADSLY